MSEGPQMATITTFFKSMLGVESNTSMLGFLGSSKVLWQDIIIQLN